MENRAETAEQKRQVIERILRAWEASPTQRLGQLLNNARTYYAQIYTGNPTDIFYVEDYDLATMVETFVADFSFESEETALPDINNQ